MKTTQEIIKEIDARVVDLERKSDNFKKEMDLENAVMHQQLAIELLTLKTFILS